MNDNTNGQFQNTPPAPLIHRLDEDAKKTKIPVFVYPIGIVLFGLLSGFFLSTRLNQSSMQTGGTSGENQSSLKQPAQVVGTNDKVFSDSAEGQLETGGTNGGEGSHKLIRPGGDSQTVYLTSSVLDMSEFSGKKVRVWGQTFAAKKAGWLMDVGKVEVLE